MRACNIRELYSSIRMAADLRSHGLYYYKISFPLGVFNIFSV